MKLKDKNDVNRMIGNNYASINKFGKFFVSYILEKAEGERK